MDATGRTVMGRIVLLTALALAVSAPATAQVRRLGVYAPAVQAESIRLTDADDPLGVFLLDENVGAFGSAAGRTAFGWSRAYVIDGQYLREFDRKSLVTGPVRSYNAGAPLLDVEAGSTEGEVILLTRSALQVVDMDALPAPRVLSSVAVANSQPVWGELLFSFGDTVYVADNAQKGFRAIDLSVSTAPREVARYVSKAKIVGKPSSFTVTELRRDGSLISLIIGGNLELIGVDNLLAPSQLTSPGYARFPGVTRGMVRGGHAFLANGVRIHIVNATPGAAGFLTEVLSFDTGATITDLFLRDGRLYLLCGKLGYEMWDVSAYAPR